MVLIRSFSMSKKIYPKIIGVCNYCKGDIVAKYGGMNKPNRKFCSISCNTAWKNKNIPQSFERRQQQAQRAALRFKGVPKTESHRLKMSLANKGSKSHFWKGGKTKEAVRLRTGVLYKMWRTAVFERDNYTCQECGVRGGVLNADHIKPWAFFPLLRFDINNGRTLCLGCHKKTETFGNKAVKFIGKI